MKEDLSALLNTDVKFSTGFDTGRWCILINQSKYVLVDILIIQLVS